MDGIIGYFYINYLRALQLGIRVTGFEYLGLAGSGFITMGLFR